MEMCTKASGGRKDDTLSAPSQSSPALPGVHTLRLSLSNCMTRVLSLCESLSVWRSATASSEAVFASAQASSEVLRSSYGNIEVTSQPQTNRECGLQPFLAYIKSLLVNSLDVIYRLFSIITTCNLSKVPEVIALHFQVEDLTLRIRCAG